MYPISKRTFSGVVKTRPARPNESKPVRHFRTVRQASDWFAAAKRRKSSALRLYIDPHAGVAISSANVAIGVLRPDRNYVQVMQNIARM